MMEIGMGISWGLGGLVGLVGIPQDGGRWALMGTPQGPQVFSNLIVDGEMGIIWQTDLSKNAVHVLDDGLPICHLIILYNIFQDGT